MTDYDFTIISAKPDDIDYVIYHASCVDGFGSAYVAESYLRRKCPGRDVTYVPAIYNKTTIGSLPNYKNKNVLICDFSFKCSDLKKIIKQTNSFIILDHHRTSEEDLKDIHPKYKIFDMNHSGIYLTWRYFYRDQSIPMMVSYIEDHDIWKNQLEKTEQFSAFMKVLPMKFEEYEKLMSVEYILNTVFVQGTTLLRKDKQIIATNIRHGLIKFLVINRKIYFVYFLNSTVLRSELGHEALKLHPNVNFSAIFSINNETIFSLRSRDTSTDVSEIAKLFNGGGHRNAAGCNFNYSTNVLPCQILESNSKVYKSLNNIYFDKYKQYNIVYLNSNIYKTHLASYLLQTRYIICNEESESHEDISESESDDDKKKIKKSNKFHVQECVSIKNNRDNTNDLFICDFAVVWNFVGSTNSTWFTINCNSYSLADKLNLLKDNPEYINFFRDHTTIKFSLKGLRNSINCVFEYLKI
jgi:Predicted phosphohydrolase (DHH superfamily)